MTGRIRRVASLAGVLLLISALLAACGGGDAGLSRAEVEEIVREEMPAATPQTDSAPGVSSEQVEGIVNEAIAEMPQPEPGLTSAEVEEIVRAAIASIPSKAAPAEYTRHFVSNAIARYEAQGLDATLAHYNSPQSVDGQWYVFIIDQNDLVIGHPDPERLGLDLKGWVGTDANGYEFGPEMLSATEEGKWVSYVYRNPESGGIGTGDFELKNVWVERHDGLLFGSGWYIDADELTRMLVSVAVDRFREGGLAATVAYFASPGSALAGLEAAIDYYNAAETVDGRWFAFIGDPAGKIAAHSDPSLIGSDDCGAAALDSSGYRMRVHGSATHVTVAPTAAESDADLEVGKATYSNGVETVAYSAVSGGSPSAAIALEEEGDTHHQGEGHRLRGRGHLHADRPEIGGRPVGKGTGTTGGACPGPRIGVGGRT